MLKLDAAKKKSSTSERANRKLKCSIEQCGGRCLRAGEVCRLKPTAEQKKIWGTAKKKAKTSKTVKPVSSAPVKKLKEPRKTLVSDDKKNEAILNLVLKDPESMSSHFAEGIPDRLRFLATLEAGKPKAETVKGVMNDLAVATKGKGNFSIAADYLIKKTWDKLTPEEKENFAVNTPSLFRGSPERLGPKSAQVHEEIADIERKLTKEKENLLEELEDEVDDEKINDIEKKLSRYEFLNERF